MRTTFEASIRFETRRPTASSSARSSQTRYKSRLRRLGMLRSELWTGFEHGSIIRGLLKRYQKVNASQSLAGMTMSMKVIWAIAWLGMSQVVAEAQIARLGAIAERLTERDVQQI